jgi:hypothetical protein
VVAASGRKTKWAGFESQRNGKLLLRFLPSAELRCEFDTWELLVFEDALLREQKRID